MKVGSLFSGIGGFDLGLERAGMEIIWQVEIDPFCNQVLARHWPNVKRYGDIKAIKGKELEPVDLICGGFPCQPFSIAGKRKGKEDNRFLWPEMFRVIKEIRPRWVVAENVVGIVKMALDDCLSDLEGEGYSTQAVIIPACAINAPHRRDRIWIVANRKCKSIRGMPRDLDREKRENQKRSQISRKFGDTIGSQDCHAPDTKGRKTFSTEPERFHSESCGQDRDATNPNRINGNDTGHGSGKVSQFKKAEISGCNSADSDKQRSSFREVFGRDLREECKAFIGNFWQEHWYEVATHLCRVDDGISHRVDRLKCLGNSVVPQIVEIIGRLIMELENER